jgi:arylformamidase
VRSRDEDDGDERNESARRMKVFQDYDQAALDAQYKTRTQMHGDHEAWSRDRRNASAEARRLLSPRLDVAYGPGPRQRLDVFPAPEGISPAPVAIFIHGGFWKGGDKSDFSLVANGLRSLGATVFVISYPLCPAAAMAEVVASARDATLWVSAHAAEFGGDPDRLWLFGHSTGAHLVAMCCCGEGRYPNELPTGMVKGALMTSGMYDLEPIRLSYLNADLHLGPDDVAHFSPTRLEPTAAGPLIVAAGTGETAEYLRHATDFAAAMKAKGARAHLVVVPDIHHYTMLQEWRMPGSRLLTQFRSLTAASTAAAGV